MNPVSFVGKLLLAGTEPESSFKDTQDFLRPGSAWWSARLKLARAKRKARKRNKTIVLTPLEKWTLRFDSFPWNFALFVLSFIFAPMVKRYMARGVEGVSETDREKMEIIRFFEIYRKRI